MLHPDVLIKSRIGRISINFRIEKVAEKNSEADLAFEVRFLGLLASEDYGKDLTSIENLLKKHQLLEADIAAHADRVNEMNMQADNLLESGQFDQPEISNRRKVTCQIKLILFRNLSNSFGDSTE